MGKGETMTLKNRSKNGISFKGPGRTRQDQKDSCDLNLMMRKYLKQGVLPRLNTKTPVYDDFSTALSYHESLDRIKRADILFAALPAQLRASCENDPAQLIAYVEGGEHIDELVDLGVMEAPEGWKPPGQRMKEEEVTETPAATEETPAE